MNPVSASLTDEDIAERIFDASSLEDAIRWRKELSQRICSRIAALDYDDPFYGAKIGNLAAAKSSVDLAIGRLSVALESGERMEWYPPYPPAVSHHPR